MYTGKCNIAQEGLIVNSSHVQEGGTEYNLSSVLPVLLTSNVPPSHHSPPSFLSISYSNMSSSTPAIPKTQTVAMVRKLGGPVEFVSDYPVPVPGENEVLAKMLYTGVCQSGRYSRPVPLNLLSSLSLLPRSRDHVFRLARRGRYRSLRVCSFVRGNLCRESNRY